LREFSHGIKEVYIQQMSLSTEQEERYRRQLSLPKIGREGQLRLLSSRVLIVGAGGLGSAAALYLAAAGVGRLDIVDFDEVELSNLQRQIIHSTESLGRPKALSAQERIRQLNPDVQVTPIQEQLDAQNAGGLIGACDAVVDCPDNNATRRLINETCVRFGKPHVYGAVQECAGQASVFLPGAGPCYRCLFPDPEPEDSSLDRPGILGVTAGVIGLIQATETIKLLLGQGDSLVGRLLLFEAWPMNFREVKIKRRPDCAVCGES
jgi:adenylyltransferase/sulfurtransferase